MSNASTTRYQRPLQKPINPVQISVNLASIYYHLFQRVTKALNQNLQEIRCLIQYFSTQAA